MKRQLVLGVTVLGAVLIADTAAWGVDSALIDRAVKAGVAAVKRSQRRDGTWPGQAGVTSLAGLTLLECGVSADDPAVKRAAAFVRNDSLTMTETYHLALGILFLDRLGEKADVPLIESMAVRLLAGQTAKGAWGYQCPNVSDEEVRRLSDLLKSRSELVAGKRRRDDSAEPDQEVKRSAKDLSPEIVKQLEAIGRANANPPANGGTPPAPVNVPLGFRVNAWDNSNTQFAVLALWVARRYGLPVETALAGADTHFRTTQNRDGGWGYNDSASTSLNTMTCAGTLALAVAHGVATDLAKEQKKNPPDPAKDLPLQAALLGISTTIDHPVAKRGGRIEVLNGQQEAYYFLWSLERVAVSLGLETIGKKDWYAWGSEILVANQREGGIWVGNHAVGGDDTIDTCFALLFLRRANLARDLTARFRNRLTDPGMRVLQAGGVGGSALKGGSIKPPSNTDHTREANVAEAKNPPKPAESESGRLVRGLIEATPASRDGTLAELRDGKGSAYTEALASAIPQLDGDAKRKAREALADRLTRMKADTLANYLQDEDAEIRRAALAVAMKDVRALTPRLIELLADPEPVVGRAAHAALKALSGKDFGPAANAERADVDKALAAWKEWWSKEGGK